MGSGTARSPEDLACTVLEKESAHLLGIGGGGSRDDARWFVFFIQIHYLKHIKTSQVKVSINTQTWWHLPVILALRRLRQEVFQGIESYIARLSESPKKDKIET